MTPDEILDVAEGLLRHAGREDAADRVVAVGVATVDLERALRNLADAGPFEPAVETTLLGARAVAWRPAHAPVVVLLEPSTEGRLAAFLARNDEGPAAVWLAPSPTLPDEGGAESGPATPGPLGPERLLPAPRQGPFVLVLDRAASTIPA